ncbi:MAG: leucyl aminopeptidase [Gammaproteobacteria bacterium]|nr:leucyl aminopeptidase [Gammaproteobacteria bacterium]
MEFGSKVSSPEKVKTACIIVPVFESGKLSSSTKQLNDHADNYLTNIIKKGDIKGKIGQTLLVHNIPGINADRVLLVGCGKEKDLTDISFRKICSATILAIKTVNAIEAICCLAELNLKDRDLSWKITQAVKVFQASEDRTDTLKSEKDDSELSLGKLNWLTDSKTDSTKINKAAAKAAAIAAGISLAKTLGDLPGNVCTPTYLAEQAKSMGNTCKSMKVTILDERKMEQLGMGALLSVSRGSRQPAKFIIMDYAGGKQTQKPIVLVGKGLTFDAGGISIKPSAGMDEMKYDMCGGASVFGTMKAIAEMGLPLNVIGVVPSSENMPDGDANKPGDIVTSLSGKTIEILNTDAEGRLILCDALTYCERLEPDTVIDVATLTGACVIALGKPASGLFSNNQKLANALIDAGEESGDRCWQMPLWDEYQDQLKSNFADIANIGGREAGSITAACFLSRFTKKFHWAHLDIAASAWNSGANKGATGRPVSLLTQYLINRC